MIKFFSPLNYKNFSNNRYSELSISEPLFFNPKYLNLIKNDLSLYQEHYSFNIQNLNDTQNYIHQVFVELYHSLINEKKYFYGCPFEIYKSTYEERLAKHLLEFQDSEEIYFIYSELLLGVLSCPYPYLDQKNYQKINFSLSKRVSFLETKANNLGFEVHSLQDSLHLDKIIPVNAEGNLDYKFNYHRIKKQLEKYEDFREKLKYLIQIKSEYLQDSKPNQDENKNELSFDRRCDIEIEKLKALMELDLVEKNNSLEAKLKKISWNIESLDLVELVKALIENKNIEARNEQIIFDFISELTGVEIKKRNSLMTLRKRKKDKTKFIQELDQKMLKWIDQNE